MVAVLASCGGNQVSLWNIPGDDTPIVSFRPEYVPDSSYGDDGADVTCLCFNKAAQILAASTASGIISIYSQNGALHDTLRPEDPLVDGNAEIPISCISFSSSALSLCSGGEDRILRLWDCKRKEIVKVMTLLDTLPSFTAGSGAHLKPFLFDILTLHCRFILGIGPGYQPSHSATATKACSPLLSVATSSSTASAAEA